MIFNLFSQIIRSRTTFLCTSTFLFSTILLPFEKTIRLCEVTRLAFLQILPTPSNSRPEGAFSSSHSHRFSHCTGLFFTSIKNNRNSYTPNQENTKRFNCFSQTFLWPAQFQQNMCMKKGGKWKIHGECKRGYGVFYGGGGVTQILYFGEKLFWILDGECKRGYGYFYGGGGLTQILHFGEKLFLILYIYI